MFSFRRYTAADRELCDQFIRKSKNGTFLFMRDYLDYHRDRFADVSAIATGPSGQIVAMFPANRIALRLVSHGGLSYGGIILDSSITTSCAIDVFGGWLDH